MFFYVQILALSFSDSLLRTKTRKAAFGGPPPTPTQIQPGTDATSLAPADFTGLPLPVGCLCRAQVLEASWGLALPKVARCGRPPARSPCPEPISWAASLGRSRPARCSVPAVETVPKEGFPDAETPPSPAASQLSESLCFLETRPRPVAGVDGLVRRGLAGGRSAGRLDTCRGCAGSLEPPAAGGGSRDRGQPGAEGPQRPPISSDSAAPSSPPPSSSLSSNSSSLPYSSSCYSSLPFAAASSLSLQLGCGTLVPGALCTALTRGAGSRARVRGAGPGWR